jgi:hypothetical protein
MKFGNPIQSNCDFDRRGKLIGCSVLDVGCWMFRRSRENCPDVRRSALDVRSSVRILFLFGLAYILFGIGRVQAQVSREYQLKAVFLYNFVQFTEWPTNVFAGTNSPIVIGIVGPDPFGPALEAILRGENVAGRPLTVQHFAQPADIKSCHLLFITQPEIRHVDEILKIVKDKPILTVCDTDTPATGQVMIRFAVENNKVHFRINAQAARRENISLSSKLLRVADMAPTGRTRP